MNGVNLIPAARVDARRKAARVRAWMVAAPLCASLLAGAYGWLCASWQTDRTELASGLAQADAEIQRIESAIAAAKATSAELKPILRAAKAVGEQPDWGLLLGLLASSLGDGAVLTSCILSPASEAGGAMGAARPTSPGPGRPERYNLSLTGVARNQEAVGALATGLEARDLFDRVTIIEARRSTFSGQDAVAFRLDCVLSDAAPEGP